LKKRFCTSINLAEIALEKAKKSEPVILISIIILL